MVKRLFAMLLVFCILLLTGCDFGTGFGTNPGGQDQSDFIPDTPQNVEIIDYDAPALKVTVTINPELELTLSYAYEILEVKPLNADAQAILEGVDLVGQSYKSGITTILEKAKAKGFLKDATKMTLIPKELASGGVKIHTGDMLIQPIWAYQQSSGVNFSVNIETTGEMLDPNQLELRATHRNGTETREDYAYKSGKIKKQVYIYADGLVRTQYHPNGPQNPPNMVSITEFPDGQIEYYTEKNGTMSGYTQYPDGGRGTFLHIFKPGPGEWANVYSRETSPDGTLTERFYKNGQLDSALSVAPDGTKTESFFENEMVVRSVTYYPDGRVHEQLWENGEPVGGGATEGIENLPSQGTTSDGGTYELTYYPDGTVKTQHTTWPNGNYSYVAYYQNGNPSHSETMWDGVYEEIFYDEKGDRISLFQRDQAGFEYNYQYEDGRCVVEVMKFPSGDVQRYDYSADGSYILSGTSPNGDYSTHYYDAKHNCISASGLRDGIYWEQSFDENGQTISEHQRHPDGTEYQYDYKDGVLIGFTVTHPDGTSEYIPCS